MIQFPALARPRQRTPVPITITAEPQNFTSARALAISEFTAALPAPAGLWQSEANWAGEYFFALGGDADKDFLAAALWSPSDDTPSLSFTRRTDVVGTNTSPWAEVLHDGDSIYATTAGNRLAVSSNGATSWTSTTGSPRVFFGGGLFVRASTSGIYTSTDAATWTQASAASISGSISFGYADGAWFIGTSSSLSSDRGIYASADGVTWTRIWSQYIDLIESATKFGNSWYVGTNEGPIVKTTNLTTATYASGVSPLYSSGSQVASTSQALAAYAYYDGSFGAIYYSADGSTWTKATLPISISTQRRGTLFTAAGRFILLLAKADGTESRYLVGSSDGTTWQSFTRSVPTMNTRLVQTTQSYASVLSNGVYQPREYTVVCDTNTTNQFRGMRFFGSQPNGTFSISASRSGLPLTYEWQTLLGGSWTNISSLIGAGFSGSQSATLTVREPTSASNNSQYRCVVSSVGTSPVTSSPATLTVI